MSYSPVVSYDDRIHLSHFIILNHNHVEKHIYHTQKYRHKITYDSSHERMHVCCIVNIEKSFFFVEYLYTINFQGTCYDRPNVIRNSCHTITIYRVCIHS